MERTDMSLTVRLKMKWLFRLVSIMVFPLLAESEQAPVEAWEFDPAFSVREQGMLLNGFDSMKVQSEGVLKLAVKWEKGSRRESFLRSSQDRFGPYDSRDLGVLEIRLRADVSREIAGSRIGMRVCLRYHKGGRSEQQIPLVVDGKFHTCRIDFSRFRHPEKSKGFYLYIHPLINLDNVDGWAGVELDYIRVFFSRDGVVRNIRLVADEKLVDMAALLQSLRPYGITLKGAELELKKLRELRRSLDSVAGSGAYEAAMELNRRFARFHSILRLGRRFKMLSDERYMLESSIARGKGETVSPREVSQLASSLGAVRRQLLHGEFDAARAALTAAERTSMELWNRLLSVGNGEIVWQSGVDAYSTGLFGWNFLQRREGLALSVDRDWFGRNFFLNRDGSRTRLSVRPDGAAFTDGEPKMEEISWTSSRWSYPCQATDGRPIEWDVGVSRLAPGAQLTSGSRSLRIAVNAGRDYRPTRILIPCRDRVKIVGIDEIMKFRWRDMAGNWLLLLCDNGLPAAPWLLTLQHRPVSGTASEDALHLIFSEKSGTIGIANLYGVRPLPPDWSAQWKTPPADVIRQCRRLNAVMTAYPWSCSEFFALDRGNGTVRIENRFGYRRVRNDWGYAGAEYAPLPPLLSMAAVNGYPAGLPEAVVNFDFDAAYGPWNAVRGDRTEFSLPLPDLRTELFCRTERLAEQQQKSRRWLLGLPYALFHFSSGRSISNFWTWYFHSFNLFSSEEKQVILRNLKGVVDRYFGEVRDEPARLCMAHRTHCHADRTEPFSGRSYLVYGWRMKKGKQLDYRDITDLAAFHLMPMQCYAALSGDWELVLKHWPQIVDLYSSVPRRTEWASMAVGTADRTLMHAIDMAPDSWLASEAVAKLARGVGDRRTEALALCIAARQTVPLCGALMRREWDMTHNNDWDWESQLPEIGYFESSYINTMRWEDARFSVSGVVGMTHSPALLRGYRTLCPDALRRFLGRMEEAYPQWADWKYIPAGKKTGQNGPLAFYRQILLRDALDEPTAELERLFHSGLFDDDEFSVWRRPVSGQASIVGLSLNGCSILSGRDAPLRILDWEHAVFRDAEFRFSTGKAVVELDSSKKFTLTLFSAVEPASVSVNGSVPAAGTCRYDQGKQELALELDPGEVRVMLLYPGWRPPQRKRSIRPVAPVTPTPEMVLCRTERELRLAAKNNSGQRDFSCEEGRPLSLVDCANTASSTPVGERKLRGVPMRLGNRAIGVSTGNSAGLPGKVIIPAKGRWKRLYFLHSSEGKGARGEVVLRYRIRYADGSSSVFDARRGLELGTSNRSGDLPNGKSVSLGKRRNATLSVWENRVFDEISGVGADFQREYRMVDRIELEFAARNGTAVLLAITGEVKPGQ